jgi:sugar phosphate isomerase/epimerase
MTDGAPRRLFLRRAAACAAFASLNHPSLWAQARPPVRLGLDLFSVRSQGWTPLQMLEFASRSRVKMVHFSELRFLGALDSTSLRSVRTRADELGLDVEVGMRSICPTSAAFDRTAGSAEEQLTRMLTIARTMRSPIVRVVLGTQADRRGDGGIDRHIDETVRVLRGMRSRIMDAGVKIAVENHAGDMQARELARLVEDAGPDYVGVCIDSGNAVWAIEDPHLTLEVLAPYVLTSHVRDSAVWKTPEGLIATRWTRMGQGTVDIWKFVRSYVDRCPGKAVSLEVIVSGAARMFNPADPAAWAIFPKTLASEYARFLALAEKGRPTPADAADPLVPAPERELKDAIASLAETERFLAAL